MLGHAVGDAGGMPGHAVGDAGGMLGHAVGDAGGMLGHAVGDADGMLGHAVGDADGAVVPVATWPAATTRGTGCGACSRASSRHGARPKESAAVGRE